MLAELLHHGDRWLAAAGGRGGRGNAKFLTNRRRAPSFAEQGEHGEERWLKLELQLMADVALVGFPNVGKSTLISVISAAKPKIADYPFTTLEPNLGVVRLDDATEFVVADIPGLIEGASEGRGLGHQFLRHVERARVLCLLVDLAALDGTDPGRAGARAARRARRLPARAARPAAPGRRHQGRPHRHDRSGRARVRARRRDPLRDLGRDRRRPRPARRGDGPARPRGPPGRRRTATASCCCGPMPTGAVVERRGRRRVPRRAAATSSGSSRSTTSRRPTPSAYISHRLERLGVNKLLARAGAADGDVVWIGDFSFEYRDVTCAVVVKIGTSSVTDDAGAIDDAAIAKLAAEVAALRAAGHEVVVVSSGAVAAGVAALGLDQPARPTSRTLQALAAAGQPRLMRSWDAALGAHGLVPAQALLVPHDFVDRRQYLHARRTLTRLLELGAVPIVNENDAIASDETRYGDNDRIAALVAHNIGAAVLVLLTDLDGLYTADPRVAPGRRSSSTRVHGRRPAARRSAPAAAAAGGGAAGMASKLEAARIASWSGVRDGDRRRRPAGRARRRGRRRAGRARRSRPTAASSPPASCGSPSPPASPARSRSTTAPAGRSSSARRACCRPASSRSTGRFGEGDTVDVVGHRRRAVRPRHGVRRGRRSCARSPAATPATCPPAWPTRSSTATTSCCCRRLTSSGVRVRAVRLGTCDEQPDRSRGRASGGRLLSAAG